MKTPCPALSSRISLQAAYRAVGDGLPAGDGCVCGAIDDGASPIALLLNFTNYGPDPLLIGDRHRSYHRSNLTSRRVLTQHDRVFLEHAASALEQPFEVDAVLFGERCYSLVLAGQCPLDLLIGE